MSETFVIRLSHELEPVTWTVLDEYGRPRGAESTGTLPDAAAAANNRRVVALLPGIDVLLLKTRLPVKGRSRQLKMVPFSLEEGLAADIDSLHFAIGDADGEDVHALFHQRFRQVGQRPGTVFHVHR